MLYLMIIDKNGKIKSQSYNLINKDPLIMNLILKTILKQMVIL